MIRQALTLAALSAVILTPVAASAQPRGHDRGGGYGRDRGGYDRGGYDRGGPPPGRQGYDDRRGGPGRGDPRDYRRNNDQRCGNGGGGGGGIIGAIAGGLLGNGANGRAIERYDGRGC